MCGFELIVCIKLDYNVYKNCLLFKCYNPILYKKLTKSGITYTLKIFDSCIFFTMYKCLCAYILLLAL